MGGAFPVRRRRGSVATFHEAFENRMRFEETEDERPEGA